MQNDKEKFKNEFKKRLYRFVLDVLKFIGSLENNQISRIIKDQLIRSSTSILGNYVEAQSASSKKDFANFFSHALKSANESKVWLTLLRDTQKTNGPIIEPFLKELSEIANILASSILTLKGKK